MMKKLLCLSAALLMAATMFAQSGKTLSLNEEFTPESMHKQLYEQTVLVKNGQIAIDFSAEKYIGKNITLSDYKGKVVFICFWGSWCGPCLKELKPENLPAVLKPYLNNKDFVFLPVAQDSRSALDKFFASEAYAGYHWLKDYTCIDGDRSLFGLYANRGVPRSVIIDKKGKVFETSIGATEYELTLVANALQKLLGEK